MPEISSIVHLDLLAQSVAAAAVAQSQLVLQPTVVAESNHS